jgi:hypothetical protein
LLQAGQRPVVDLPPVKVVVDARVAGLFMSSLAGSISGRLGMAAATEEFSNFALLALKDVGSTAQFYRDPVKLMLATIQAIVPGNIGEIDVTRYREIRSAYADIRFPFFNFMSELDRYHHVSSIQDSAVYTARLKQLANEFAAEVEKVRVSAVRHGITHWAKFSVFAILKIAASLLHWDGVGDALDTLKEARRLAHQPRPLAQPGAELKVRMASLQHDLLEEACVRIPSSPVFPNRDRERRQWVWGIAGGRPVQRNERVHGELTGSSGYRSLVQASTVPPPPVRTEPGR